MIYEEIAGLFFFRGNSNNNLGNGLKLGTIPYIQKTSSEPLKVKKNSFYVQHRHATKYQSL